MLQVYSNNLTLTVPAVGVVFVPFNNIAKDKGCDSLLSAPSTVQVNRQGVYNSRVNCSIAPAVAGDYIVQLYVDGVAVPEAFARFTGVADSYESLSFEDLVTVARGNCNCCYSSPTLLQVGISSVDDVTGEVDIANISHLLTRIC